MDTASLQPATLYFHIQTPQGDYFAVPGYSGTVKACCLLAGRCPTATSIIVKGEDGEFRRAEPLQKRSDEVKVNAQVSNVPAYINAFIEFVAGSGREGKVSIDVILNTLESRRCLACRASLSLTETAVGKGPVHEVSCSFLLDYLNASR